MSLSLRLEIRDAVRASDAEGELRRFRN